MQGGVGKDELLLLAVRWAVGEGMGCGLAEGEVKALGFWLTFVGGKALGQGRWR